MADPAMKPLTALGQDAPMTVEIGGIKIVERFDVALASLACRMGREKEFAKAAKALKLVLPEPAMAQEGSPFGAFWVAPQMWFVEAPFASHEDIVAALKPGFGEAASITEQTDAWVRLDLSASDLGPVLERLTNLDLAKLPQGYASRTVIEHLGTYLIKRGEGAVTIYGPRASAGSLLHALEVTAKSVIPA